MEEENVSFFTKDKQELIVTCNCGCEEAFHLKVNRDEEDDFYSVLYFMKSNFDTEYAISPWRAFKIKMRKIWCILRNKDYYYSDVILTKADFAELKRYLGQF